MKVNCQPNYQAIQGSLVIPGDKSISHRSIIFAAIASGQTIVKDFLAGADCIATINAFRQLGVIIEQQGTTVTIDGVGLHGLKPTKSAINLGNSGTSMRLLTGLLATQKFDSVLIGDESLNQRPMARIVQPLSQMGCNIQLTANNTAPITITAANTDIQAINYQLPVASAQVKSAILLAGLYADLPTTVIEPTMTRDHTEYMLRLFGANCKRNKQQITLDPVQNLTSPKQIRIPADISSAAFFIVAALIQPKSCLTLKNVGINPTRAAVITILQQMGANIILDNIDRNQFEPTADIVVSHSELQGIAISEDLIANAIDELPIIAIAANCATGVTTVKGARELRYKESDRIKSIVKGFQSLQGRITEYQDGFAITPTKFQAGVVDSFGDHRIAMAFIIASLNANGQVTVANCQNIATSFPNFTSLCEQIGMPITTLE